MKHNYKKVLHFGHYGQYYPELGIVVIACTEEDERETSHFTGTRVYSDVKEEDLPLLFPKVDFAVDYYRHGLVTPQEHSELVILKYEKDVKELQRQIAVKKGVIGMQKKTMKITKKM